MSSKIILPTYIAKQPSTGKSIKFRPFTVKEEKALLLALQESSLETTIEAIKSVISVCTDGAIDPETVPYYDVEYIFLQIRSKSVGEIIELVGSCECGPTKKTEFSVDIANLEILPKPTGTTKIKIVDTDYTIDFKHPSISDFAMKFDDSDSASEEVVANCILSVFTSEEVMNWSKKEKLEFVESMTTKQQKEICEFLSNMPMVKLNAEYTCRHCKKEHSTVLSGFENFFV